MGVPEYRGAMQHVERSARIPASPEKVFDFVSDLDRLPDWQSGIVSADLTSNGPIGVGSTALVMRRLMGQSIRAPLTIVEYDPPRRLVIDGEVSGVRASAVLELAEADGGATDLSFAMDISASGMTRFMEPMIAGAAGADIDQSLRTLVDCFSDDPPGPGSS